MDAAPLIAAEALGYFERASLHVNLEEELHQWLQKAGINPETEVRIAILPPPLVVEHMRQGYIDGFCAGEPWNSVAALSGEGWIVATNSSLAPNHPEKILVCTQEMVGNFPEEYADAVSRHSRTKASFST